MYGPNATHTQNKPAKKKMVHLGKAKNFDQFFFFECFTSQSMTKSILVEFLHDIMKQATSRSAMVVRPLKCRIWFIKKIAIYEWFIILLVWRSYLHQFCETLLCQSIRLVDFVTNDQQWDASQGRLAQKVMEFAFRGWQVLPICCIYNIPAYLLCFRQTITPQIYIEWYKKM